MRYNGQLMYFVQTIFLQIVRLNIIAIQLNRDTPSNTCPSKPLLQISKEQFLLTLFSYR